MAGRGGMSEELFHYCSPRAEAWGLYQMLGHDGNTLEELQKLIAIPPRIEQSLRAFARAHPEDSPWIEASLNFRLDVARVFERLEHEGITEAELPAIEEPGLDATEEAYAEAQR
jgi:hypothetical protein